jgi:hypothetical protein
MARYLLAMLTQRAGREGGDPFNGLSLGGPEDGRWGDYVFNQEGRRLKGTSRAELRRYSFGPDHYSNHGTGEFLPPSSGHR